MSDVRATYFAGGVVIASAMRGQCSGQPAVVRHFSSPLTDYGKRGWDRMAC